LTMKGMSITRNPLNFNRYQFLNRELQIETGLVDLMKRQYNPQTGQFTSQDPVIEGQEHLSLYQYGWNNPILKSDPNGDCPNCVTAGIGALLKGGIELGGQLVAGKGSFRERLNNVDWADVGVEAAKGAIAGSGAGLFTVAAAEIVGAGLKGSTDINITGNGLDVKSVFNKTKSKSEAIFDGVSDYAAGKIGDVASKKIVGAIGDYTKKAIANSDVANRALGIAKNYVSETTGNSTANKAAKNYVRTLSKEATTAEQKKIAGKILSSDAVGVYGNVINESFQNRANELIKKKTQ
jgi:RHS repeat-associated protein